MKIPSSTRSSQLLTFFFEKSSWLQSASINDSDQLTPVKSQFDVYRITLTPYLYFVNVGMKWGQTNVLPAARVP